MANVEIFFGNHQVINLTASVGVKGVNLRDDVMVVQAMLKYALRENPYFRNYNFPTVTGAINNQTKSLIKDYQRYLRRKDKQDVAVDGVIDRAVGEKPFGSRDFWTILYLNSHVLKARLLSGGEGNEFEDLCRKNPELYAALDNIPVGSLTLSLEPSIQRFGSLNLGLE